MALKLEPRFSEETPSTLVTIGPLENKPSLLLMKEWEMVNFQLGETSEKMKL